MFIELVGSLRCVRPHALTWLVASARQMAERDIMRGELGCHICGAEYPIVHGVADFTTGAPPRASVLPMPAPSVREEMATRAAALLDLTEPGGFVILAGAWGAAAPILRELVGHVHLLLLNAPPGIESGHGISLARASDTIPVRPRACRGVALDASHTSPDLVASAVDALRLRGRLIAPAALPVPPAMTELARDARHWVGVKERSAGPVVQIGTPGEA